MLFLNVVCLTVARTKTINKNRWKKQLKSLQKKISIDREVTLRGNLNECNDNHNCIYDGNDEIRLINECIPNG